jgi:hypothetical protein
MDNPEDDDTCSRDFENSDEEGADEDFITPETS